MASTTTRFSFGTAKVSFFSLPPNFFATQNQEKQTKIRTQERNMLTLTTVYDCYNFVKRPFTALRMKNERSGGLKERSEGQKKRSGGLKDSSEEQEGDSEGYWDAQ